MSISVNRASAAVFVTGLLFMLIGAVAVGVAIAPQADAARGWKLANLHYLAPKDSLFGDPCGQMSNGTKDPKLNRNAIFEFGYSDFIPAPTSLDDLILCAAQVRVIP